MRRNRRRIPEHPPLTPRQFIQAWQESSSVAEVAAKVKRKKATCRVRAFRYRRLGVPLKEFPPVHIVPPDWIELAQYAASLLTESSDRNADRPGLPADSPATAST